MIFGRKRQLVTVDWQSIGPTGVRRMESMMSLLKDSLQSESYPLMHFLDGCIKRRARIKS